MSNLYDAELKSVKLWKTNSSKVIADCKIFTVHQNNSSIIEEQNEHSFFVLHPRNWINVIPLTPENNVIMIEQFRHGIEQLTLEIPGGMIDDQDFSASHAAARELLEETGYSTEEMIELGFNHPNPAIQNNICYTFLARNVQKMSEPQLDGTEDILLRIVPLTEIPHLIRTGIITHALVIAAFHYFQLHLQ